MKKFLLTFSEHILFPKAKVRDSEIHCKLPFDTGLSTACCW